MSAGLWATTGVCKRIAFLLTRKTVVADLRYDDIAPWMRRQGFRWRPGEEARAVAQVWAHVRTRLPDARRRRWMPTEQALAWTRASTISLAHGLAQRCPVLPGEDWTRLRDWVDIETSRRFPVAELSRLTDRVAARVRGRYNGSL